MASPVSAIPNLGPASEAAFARAGIVSAGEIRAMGADAAYLRLIESGSAPHFIGYCALVMGLQGRLWNDCKEPEKAALRVRFEALKAQARGSDAGRRTALEAELDALGVVARR